MSTVLDEVENEITCPNFENTYNNNNDKQQ